MMFLRGSKCKMSCLFPLQPPRFEARELVVRREEQHQDRRLRHGVSAGRGQSAGDQLRVSETSDNLHVFINKVCIVECVKGAKSFTM